MRGSYPVKYAIWGSLEFREDGPHRQGWKTDAWYSTWSPVEWQVWCQVSTLAWRQVFEEDYT